MTENLGDFASNINFLECSKCGVHLSWEATQTTHGRFGLKVFPCPRCLLEEHDRAYDAGFDNARPHFGDDL